MDFSGYAEAALCTRNPTSRTHSSSSAPSHSALSASAKTRAQADFFRPFKVGWKMTKSCSWKHKFELNYKEAIENLPGKLFGRPSTLPS